MSERVTKRHLESLLLLGTLFVARFSWLKHLKFVCEVQAVSAHRLPGPAAQPAPVAFFETPLEEVFAVHSPPPHCPHCFWPVPRHTGHTLGPGGPASAGGASPAPCAPPWRLPGARPGASPAPESEAAPRARAGPPAPAGAPPPARPPALTPGPRPALRAPAALIAPPASEKCPRRAGGRPGLSSGNCPNGARLHRVGGVGQGRFFGCFGGGGAAGEQQPPAESGPRDAPGCPPG